MKTIRNILLLTIILFFNSCSSDDQDKIPDLKYNISNLKKNISWTAYKKTERVAVEGGFKTIKITEKGKGNTIRESLNEAAFLIPIEDLSAAPVVGIRVITYFFGKLVNPNTISGTFNIEDDKKGSLSLQLGGMTKKVPFTYSIQDNVFNLNTSLNLSNWDTAKALISLNTACGSLHSGADGIAKVWDDITIKASIDFNK